MDTAGTRKSLTEDLYDVIIENEIKSPDSGAFDWTQVRQFNLMFKTAFGATASEDDAVYLRPETAQGIFVNYKNVLDLSVFGCHAKIWRFLEHSALLVLVCVWQM